MNMTDWWNYLLASLDVVGLVALRAVGQKKAVGWLWAMFTQAVWIVYSVATFQWGFLAVALVKLGVYTWNWVSWVHSDKAQAKEDSLDDLARQLIERACPHTDPERKDAYADSVVKFVSTAKANENDRHLRAAT